MDEFGDARPCSREEHIYDPRAHVIDTKAFLAASGLIYHPVTVRILTRAENACTAKDERGITRIIRWADMSFASETIARQCDGVVELKVRKWV